MLHKCLKTLKYLVQFPQDPVQCERIEEAVQNMTFTTYGLLKTAELACRDQDNPNARRRLTDAVGELNDAIRRLVSYSLH